MALSRCPRSLPLLWLLCFLFGQAAALSYDYYASTCPNVEDIVRSAMRGIFVDIRAPAAMIRLAFHDCQVDGCDASILLDQGSDGTAEIESPSNLGIHKLNAIDTVKNQLEAACPQTVSCADIIALAAREAVAQNGGPNIRVPLGRLDGFDASASAATKFLPLATISAAGTIDLFGAMGMTPEESVAILGSHTVGVAHCTNFANRLYPQLDPNLGLVFGASLRARCPRLAPVNLVATLDTTFLRFDNSYFRNVLNNRGLLTADLNLALDPRTRPIVETFANDQDAFFQAFSSAFVKLTSYRVHTGNQGEVRLNCHFTNS
ncbi:hypothetical protein KP509_17G009900 [Ceratopteris richardii]|uniref:Peroxidase n=1 Tax=Ceratopteris richardii TaxID=49495 RepID=A0A8T2SWT2_CERRI|nr:hypothetical protein KP509_17G009900 [Ceratopteris richardii]